MLIVIEGGDDEDPGQRELIAAEDDLVASSPCMMGIWMSIRTTSGLRPVLAYRLDASTGLPDDAEIGCGVGLDPDFTVNAWGGLTYLGAMACHYLDVLVLMVAARLLGRIVLPDPGSAHSRRAAAGHKDPAERAV